MAPRISKTQRWLDLLSFLIGRRFPVAVTEIMERVPAYAERWNTEEETARATALRTFERDKDELRRLGIPLETVTYSINFGGETAVGYRLTRRDFYLPYLRLLSSSGEKARGQDASRIAEFGIEPEDAHDALDALRFMASLPGQPLSAPAQSAFRKLAFDLEPAGLSASPVVVAARPESESQGERVQFLSEALQERRRVRFQYRGIHSDTVTDREVEPYGVLYQGGSWYLVARDPSRDAMRLFRLDRMEGAGHADPASGPEYEIPSDFRLQDYLHREAWELGDEEPGLEAMVRFQFPLSLWAERNGYGTRVEELDEGAAVHRFHVRQIDPFVRWLLALEGEAEVLSPPELQAELREMAQAVATLYRTEIGEPNDEA